MKQHYDLNIQLWVQVMQEQNLIQVIHF